MKEDLHLKVATAQRPATGSDVDGECELWAWISDSTEARISTLGAARHFPRRAPLQVGRCVAAAMAHEGYCVLRGVLSPAECSEEMDRLWG